MDGTDSVLTIFREVLVAIMHYTFKIIRFILIVHCEMGIFLKIMLFS